MDNEAVGTAILMEGMDYALNSHLNIDDIEDLKLRDLCRQAKTAMENVRFYLEDVLGDEFFEE
jgi:hypothetical protein